MMATSALPEDILIEILSRLPVKSLLCYRSVSKFWNSLIQSPAFIKLHQKHSQIRKQKPSLFVLRSIRVSFYPYGNGWYKTVCSSLEAETLASIADLDYHELPSVTYPKEDTLSRIKLYGPCNGIIFMQDPQHDLQDYFVLCNPATREFKTLPHPPFSYPENMVAWNLLTGFGFDEIVDDYKLVRVVRPRCCCRTAECTRLPHCDNYTHFYGPWRVEMYNLRDDTWKEVDVELPFSSDFVTCSEITYVNTCHWIGYETTYDEDERDQCVYILVFDLVEEVFRKIQLPEKEDFFQGLDDRGRIVLIVYDGSLALIKYDFDIPEYGFQLWVMREYGLLESWENIHIGHLNGIYRPLAIRNANELFLESNDGDMVLCDLATEAITAIGLSGMSDTFEVIIFQECLTLIKGYCSANQ